MERDRQHRCSAVWMLVLTTKQACTPCVLMQMTMPLHSMDGTALHTWTAKIVSSVLCGVHA